MHPIFRSDSGEPEENAAESLISDPRIFVQPTDDQSLTGVIKRAASRAQHVPRESIVSPPKQTRSLRVEEGDRLGTPVQMTVEWEVSPPESGAILSALHALMVTARSEPGCVCCHLTTEMGDRTGLRYVEKWNDEEDLKRQLRSPRFARLAELMERAVKMPKVEFTLAAGVRGLDYAADVRGHGGEAA